MNKMILTEADGVRFTVDTGYEHSIDMTGDKAYFEYAFTPYAALRNALFQRCGESLEIGTDETPVLCFKRKEFRIKLLQKIYAGHELSEDLFIMIGLGKPNSAVVFNTNTLFWQMASDMGYSEDDKVPPKDFAAFLEKTFYLGREEAWRFAWTVVRTAYVGYWPSVRELLDLAYKIPVSKGKERDKAKAAFSSVLESQILWLKTEIKL